MTSLSMKKLYLSYLPPIFFRVAEKRSFVPRLAAFFHAHARCSECFSESPYIPPFIAPFLIHVSTILSNHYGFTNAVRPARQPTNAMRRKC